MHVLVLLQRLKQHLVEMERLKSRVQTDDLFDFELRVRPAKTSAVAALQAFCPSDEGTDLAGLNPSAAAGAGWYWTYAVCLHVARFPTAI